MLATTGLARADRRAARDALGLAQICALRPRPPAGDDDAPATSTGRFWHCLVARATHRGQEERHVRCGEVTTNRQRMGLEGAVTQLSWRGAVTRPRFHDWWTAIRTTTAGAHRTHADINETHARPAPKEPRSAHQSTVVYVVLSVEALSRGEPSRAAALPQIWLGVCRGGAFAQRRLLIMSNHTSRASCFPWCPSDGWRDGPQTYGESSQCSYSCEHFSRFSTASSQRSSCQVWVSGVGCGQRRDSPWSAMLAE